jgi:hypothetical protein
MNRMKKVLILLVLVFGFSGVVQAQNTQVLLAEDFEGLELGPNVDEGTAGDAVWTDIPSAGWINDASAMPGVDDPATDGVTEWAGWGFADKDWWVQTAGDQRRVEFELGQGTVAIADPDEWDDAAHANGTFDVQLSTAPIDLSAFKAGTVKLQFDSSWRPYASQTALVTATFDGADPVEVVRFDSDAASPNYKDDESTNETIVVDIDNPANAARMVLTFRLFDAGNDWFWAIDNILVTAEASAERAANPSPGNGANELTVKTVLGWTPGEYVSGLSPKHKIILSENLEAVTDGSAVVSTQDDSRFDATGILEYGTTYYWRIDEANRTSDWDEGSIWQFTTEPYSIPVASVHVTASSRSSDDMGPEKIIDGSGLNELNQHDTESFNMWLSDKGDASPWIQFEFNRPYKLDKMLVWNSNQLVEPFVGLGIKDVTIETSTDGTNWIPVDGLSQLAQAPGAVDYEVNTVVDFSSALAQYVKLSINSGYGPLGQYGLSEVQFFSIPTIAREPMPVDEATTDEVDVELSWRAGREAVSHQVYLGTVTDDLNLVATTDVSRYTTSGLNYDTTYFWQVVEVNEAMTPSRYDSPVRSFKTPAYGVVDDFEAYTNDEGTRVYEFWHDGWDDDNNGSQVGYSNEPFAEKTIVKSGGQSMPLAYDNNAGVGMSEATLNFDPPQDWTTNGIKSLSLSFRGALNNSGQLYIKINNTKIDYRGLPNALQMSAWLPMVVDLSTVSTDVSAVTSLTVGIEGSGAEGLLYIDNVSLYPLAADSVGPVTPTDDDAGLLGLWKLDDGNGVTAADASGTNQPGVLTGDPQWIADGAMGGALDFDAVADYVILGDLTYGDDTDFSVALWVRSEGWDSDAAMISNKDWNSGGNPGWAIAGGGGNNGSWQWNYSDGSSRVDFDPSVSQASIAEGGWNHLCVTHDRDGLATFYFDGQLIGERDISAVTGSLDAGLPTVLGTDGAEASVWEYWFHGAFDDVRIYNRVLSDAEVYGIIGATDPVANPF